MYKSGEITSAVTDSTATGQTDANQPSAAAPTEEDSLFLGFLPAESFLHICRFLDLNALIPLLRVEKKIRVHLQEHIIKKDFWREKLLADFQIPLEISDTFLFPHLVHERLTMLANHLDDEISELFSKIRFAFSAPGFDPFSMPWLFFPFRANSHARFIDQLKEDGKVFQAYYLDMACKAGNFHFVQFMVQKYSCKLYSKHLKNACISGNLALVAFCAEKHKIEPSEKSLSKAAGSGNVSLVKYLIRGFKLQPDDHTLECAILSGNHETVEYLDINYKLNYSAQALSFAIKRGETELITRLPGQLTTEDIEYYLCENTISLKLIQYLIEKKNFIPTEETLHLALISTRGDLIEFLINTLSRQNTDFKPDFSLCALSGDITFVNKIIKEKNQVPDLQWLLAAILSGNVLLVKYLIETHSLDPQKINLGQLPKPYNMMLRYVFCHVPMAKYLIEEHGCIPIQDRILDYIQGKNLPLARYLITECGLHIKGDLQFQRNPDHPLANIFQDGRVFEDLMEMVGEVVNGLLYATQFQYHYQKQLSANPLLCAFRMQESYHFEQLHPEYDLSALGKTLISAMSLFIRQRLQNFTYLEIAPPCSHKKQNAQAVLLTVAAFLKQKLAQTGKPTKSILIPFTIDEEDREWHLLELSFDQDAATCEKSLAATIYSTKDYLYCRKDDPNRAFVHESIYYQNEYTASSEEQVLNTHFSSILNSVEAAFWQLTNKTYSQSAQSRLPNSSVFSVLMTMLSHLKLILPDKMYEDQRSRHPLNRQKGGTFYSTLAMSHWQTEVLGFLFVNLNKIPDLIQKGFGKTDDMSNLERTLSSAFYEEDRTAPKLVSYLHREGSNQVNKKNNDYYLIKEAFLETFEFDGYNAATKEFTPGLPEDPIRRYEFPTEALTFWTALAIFFGIPSRPEKACLDEGAVWTGRQFIRNFFGGWNPAQWHFETGENNIEGKVLLNFILLFVPVKIAIAVFKLVSIPFKITLNFIKLLTEFLPALALRTLLLWSEDLYNLRLKKIKCARGLFSTALACTIYGGLSFFNFVLFVMVSLLHPTLRTATSPEKSARMVWEKVKTGPGDPIDKCIEITALFCYTYLGTVIFWTCTVAVIWTLAIPFIVIHFPTLVALFTTLTHAPIISSSILFIKSSMISLWALVGETNIGVLNLGLIAATPLTIMIASRLADEFSNAWARWVPAKPTSKFEFPEIAKEDNAALKRSCYENNPAEDPSLQTSKDALVIYTGFEDAEEKANESATNVATLARRVDEHPLNRRSSAITPHLDTLPAISTTVTPDLYS
ncbi:MAG: ankyrin repeat domain-containing protein [Gammaproteobacteria bacterium]|nr:ankyrin repeat domain-containing protein [Gammaproteobacteria bacterium]